MPNEATLSEPWDRILLTSPVMTVGTFSILPSDPHFATAGQITAPVFVFPRTAVWIQHDGHHSFVADPSVVTYYNSGQHYVRRRLSEQGDHCHWFRVDPAILREVVRMHDSAASEQEHGPFPFAQGPSDARSYLSQRLVIKHLREACPPDHLFVEETILGILHNCVARAFRNLKQAPKAVVETGNKRQRDIAYRIREILAERLDQPLNLMDLAAEVDCSVFHLCRLFRAWAGTTIHRHLSELRLRASLDLLDDAEQHLTQLALELGYSSHSHFTAAFRRAFGNPPSRLKRLSKAQIRELVAGGCFNKPTTNRL